MPNRSQTLGKMIAGGIEEEGHEKNYGFKGEVKRKNGGLKRGSPPKKPSNFAVPAFVIMQTAYQNAKKQRFWHSESSNVPEEACPQTPYSIMPQKAILFHQNAKKHKSIRGGGGGRAAAKNFL